MNPNHSIRNLASMALIAIALAGLALPATARGEEQADGLSLSYSAGVDFVTQYFFRGILQEDAGFIAQPWAEVGANLYSGNEGDALNSIDVSFGTWHSIHSEQTGTDDDGPKSLYEADLYTGVSFGLYDNWAAGVVYTLYNSPNSAFDDVQDIQINVSYDDSGLWGNMGESVPGFSGLQPNVTILFETKNAADGAHEGVYLQIGIEPSFTPLSNGNLKDLTVSIPVTLGLSADDYYESPTNGGDESFGFLETGIKFSYPINERWEISAGPYFMFLGNTAEDFNDGDDNSFEVIGKLGVSVSF